jgi:hypothetical protein
LPRFPPTPSAKIKFSGKENRDTCPLTASIKRERREGQGEKALFAPEKTDQAIEFV